MIKMRKWKVRIYAYGKVIQRRFLFRHSAYRFAMRRLVEGWAILEIKKGAE